MIFAFFSVPCCATCKEKPGVAGSTFDGGWGTKWWRDVSGGVENEEWAVGVEQDDCRVSDEEDSEVGEVKSLVGLLDGIWSEVVLSGEEKSWWKDGDVVNVCNFDGAVRELRVKFWHFRLKGVAVADSDWDENNWKTNLWPTS